MDYDVRVMSCQKIHEKANSMRGRFLNHVAVIDITITALLAVYFCPVDERKRHLLRYRVLSNSIQKKKSVLLEIIKIDYPNYWIENKAHLEALTEIIEFRNCLAHSALDLSEIALVRPLNDGIGFLNWKNGSPVVDAEFNEFLVKANMFSGCLADIERLLPFIQKSA